MNTIVSRIREIIEYKGISERKFCAEIGVSSGFLSKVSDVGSSKVAKILNVYPEISPSWLLIGEGEMLKSSKEGDSEILSLIDDNKEFLAKYFINGLLPHHYEYTFIKYYSSFTEKRIEELLELEIDQYEERYNDYYNLVDFLLYIDPPDFLVKKFTSKYDRSFKESLELEKIDFDDDTEGLADSKLKNILFIIRVKTNVEHWCRSTSRLINYMGEYKDMIKEKIIIDHNGTLANDLEE